MESCAQPSKGTSDGLEVTPGDRPFDLSATAWLVGQGVQYLNAEGEEGKHGYGRVTEVLAGRADAVNTITQLARKTARTDVPLRWSLIYLLGDVGDAAAGEFLTRVALEALPAREEQRGCEGPRDGELLIRTIAVEALQRVAVRHPETAELLLRVAAEHPDRAVLIEAVKAAVQLGLRDKVREVLGEKDSWILDIRQVRAEEIGADPERKDTGERGFTPPKMPSQATTPVAPCRTRKEG
jgi:hypothetical protein